MPGSGIRSYNIKALQAFTDAQEIHSSARLTVKSSMQYHPNSMKENMENILVDTSEIKAMKALLS
jgi:copper homeostasis protein